MFNKLVYVYGTLKSGFGNHRILETSEFVGEVTTKPFYRLYNVGHYPGLVEDAETGKAIQGELYRVTDPAVMQRLDRLEGIPWLYRREYLKIEGMEDDEVQGYIYNQDYSDLEECSPKWEG
jgi:gamma-glutamylcyclotransferase (GGCT)/AIG2-like uncharacterized protein YtfP